MKSIEMDIGGTTDAQVEIPRHGQIACQFRILEVAHPLGDRRTPMSACR